MYNVELRNAIKRSGFHQYEVAAALGISEVWFSRKMARSELPKNEQQHVLATIEKMEIYRSERQ